jgi:hypothetical protein
MYFDKENETLLLENKTFFEYGEDEEHAPWEEPDYGIETLEDFKMQDDGSECQNSPPPQLDSRLQLI